MAQQGLVPDVISYMGLLSVCGQGKQPGRALVVLAATVQQSSVPELIACDAEAEYLLCMM